MDVSEVLVYSTDSLNPRVRETAIEYVNCSRESVLSGLLDQLKAKYFYRAFVNSTDFKCLLTDDNMFFIGVGKSDDELRAYISSISVKLDEYGNKTFSFNRSVTAYAHPSIDYYGAELYPFRYTYTGEITNLVPFIRDNRDQIIAAFVNYIGQDAISEELLSNCDVIKSGTAPDAFTTTGEIRLHSDGGRVVYYFIVEYGFVADITLVRNDIFSAKANMRYRFKFCVNEDDLDESDGYDVWLKELDGDFK